MINQKNRSGISQDDRLLTALQPEYVSVEERSISDLLKYLRDYAQEVRFYEENQTATAKFWSEFLNFEDGEILELAQFIENPAIFYDDQSRLQKYSRPHLAVLLVFLKLLQYPQAKFAELTEKKAAFFYREILKLTERDEIPDQVHVTLALARDVREHLIKKGTLLSAGKDGAGVDLHYEVTEDTVINNAQLSDIKTVYFSKTKTDLKYIHQSYNKGDAGFEKILRLVLGNLDALPPYQTASGNTIPVDGRYLRTELYQRVKGKEKDELDSRDADYIFHRLCFRFVKDFWYCLNLYYREMNRGYAGVTYPEDGEWEKAYLILEGVHRERIARVRRAELKAIHQEFGFETMMEYAFGEPEPWNMLYKMPDNIDTLAKLAAAKNEAARKYIENQLCMTDDDFRVIMAKQEIALTQAAGDEVYTLLEAAWTRKRGYQYPEIGAEQVKGYYAETVFSAETARQVGRFQTFGKASAGSASEPVQLGLAVSSPLLDLQEGTRRIELVISCKKGTIDYDQITALLRKKRPLFTAWLSVNGGWQEADQLDFEIGQFITQPELKNYSREYCSLVCNILTYPLFQSASVGKYLVFPDRRVYRILKYDLKNTRIFLRAVGLEFPAAGTTLIKRLMPRNFTAAISTLVADEWTRVIESPQETFADYYPGKYLVDCSGKIFLITGFISASAVEVRYCGAINANTVNLPEKVAIPEPEDEDQGESPAAFVIKSQRVTFAGYDQGKFLIDAAGEVFRITGFISAGEVELLHLGPITENAPLVFSDDQLLMINKVWETIEPEYEDIDESNDISSLRITGIYSAERQFSFEVADGRIKISYPEGATARELIAAWEEWKDKPDNQPGRYQIQMQGAGAWLITPLNTNLERTGEAIWRYESTAGEGLRVTYRGRPEDQAELAIEKPSPVNEATEFLVSGGVLKITPGKVSQTANQIEADWRLWIEDHDPKGFRIESKENHLWEAARVSEAGMVRQDKQIKRCEIRNPYGIGIRVWYTGPIAAQPKLILEENTIDLFEFETRPGPQLRIKYPALSVTSAYDLVEAWQAWKASELNDPGNFEIEQLGDGLWTIEARTERELLASENRIIECTIDKAGIIARYKLTDNYQNAIITFSVKTDSDADPDEFSFLFEDVDDVVEVEDADPQTIPAKKLTIKFPAIDDDHDNPDVRTDYQIRHVQKLLTKWNREYKKYGFSLIIKEDNAKWLILNTDEPLEKNFLKNLNYVRTIEPDGFIVKYHPVGSVTPPFPAIPNAKVVLHENPSATDTFAFQLSNDYYHNLKILYIKYPSSKTKRTVPELLKAWKHETGAYLEPGSLHWEKDGVLGEFTLESTGTGKWELVGVTELRLTAAITEETGLADPVYQKFYEYKTSDVKGFTIYYTGPWKAGASDTSAGAISTPLVKIEENPDSEIEAFTFNVIPSREEFFNIDVGQSLEIYYPKRADKRQIVDLLAAWQKYKQANADRADLILGFEIVNAADPVEPRPQTRLLATGDRVYDYQAGAGNGLGITYIGHRSDPAFQFEPILDFQETDLQKKLLWENGAIFTIQAIEDQHYAGVEPETGWMDCLDAVKLYAHDAIRLEALKFTIRLDADFPAVVPAPGAELSQDPAMKLVLKNTLETNEPEEEPVLYEYFKSIELEGIDLRVLVQGLRDIKMRGDIALINPANPFHPFGITPEVPARFYFANREICAKKLDSLRIQLDWNEEKFLTPAGLPDLEQYYYAYSHFGHDQGGTIQNQDFEVKLQFLDRRTWIPIGDEPQPLLRRAWSYHDFEPQTYQGKLFPEGAALPVDPLNWPRYYKLELSNQGFMKELYRELLSEAGRAQSRFTIAQNTYEVIKQEIRAREKQVQAAMLAEAQARQKDPPLPFSPPVIPEARPLPLLPENDRDIMGAPLNTPYSPVIRAMRIDYTASAKLSLAGAGPAASAASAVEVPVQLFRFHPFGDEAMGKTGTLALRPGADDYLLPRFEQEGYLYLGLKNLAPGQPVSLLIQMVSGSGDVNQEMPSITWSYLAANQWIPFQPSEILKDKTFGLQDTGVIRFLIPPEATTGNTILPGSRCWICAAAEGNTAAVPDILDIRAGALTVTYRNQNNDPDHLALPLAVGTIKELAKRDPAVKEVIQPYTSFNGKRRENREEFQIRVSERLKHKNRALTLDDYEKMILTQFPQVYKVKCIPQGEIAQISALQMDANFLTAQTRGEVVIMVILKNANSAPFFPLKPKTPTNILEEIERYIKAYMPPLVTVTVRNPRFEEIKYRLAVKFTQGYDRGYYINVLIDDIKRFLSPWAYEKDAKVSFGSSVYSSALINYLENKDYVDYIANFNLLQQIIHHENYTEVLPLFLTEDNAATVKYPDSILVSADSHMVDVITTELFDPGAYSGIGHMQIGTDFWISRPGPVFAVGLGEMEIESWPVPRYVFAAIEFQVAVTATVNHTEHHEENLVTHFARADSQKIWTALTESHYLDSKGNVITTQDLYDEDFRLTLNGLSFTQFITAHLPDFEFQISATDFEPTATRQTPFSYQVAAIKNIPDIEGAVLEYLKTGLSFDGISQFPWMVY